tara:strand:- start:209 stop:1468 length:1260 start_codon:yes stop_codon:yes gene_type:complete
MLLRLSEFRILNVFVVLFFLTSCSSTSSVSYKSAGSGYASNISQTSKKYIPPVPLEILIPVFNGGIEQLSEEEKETFSDLRRAESIFFANLLKDKIEERGAFVNPKVMPSNRAAADIYVNAEILKSNGHQLQLKVEFQDSRNEILIPKSKGKNKVSKFRNKNGIYTITCNNNCRANYKNNPRLKGKTQFNMLFSEVAKDLELAVRSNERELKSIQRTKEIRFAQTLSPERFEDYTSTKRKSGRYIQSLEYYPDSSDPMFMRTQSIRLAEQMFIDESQKYISDHANKKKFLEQYEMWQEQSGIAEETRLAAKAKQTGNAIGGILLLALAVAAGSDNADAAVAGGLAATALFNRANKFGKEAETHKAAIKELEMDVSYILVDQNIEFEDAVFEARGSVGDQFIAYKEHLKKIYDNENMQKN